MSVTTLIVVGLLVVVAACSIVFRLLHLLWYVALAAVLAFVMSGCGSPTVIDPGMYRVDLFYKMDGSPGADNMTGRWSEAFWNVSFDERYVVEIVGSSTKFVGDAIGNRVDLEYTTNSSDCKTPSTLTLSLVPFYTPDRFCGDARQDIFVCPNLEIQSIITVFGRKVDDNFPFEHSGRILFDCELELLTPY